MLGAKLDVDAQQLFAYRPGSIVVELRAGYQNAAFTPVGRVTEEPVLRAAGVELPLTEALRVFEGTLENVFPIHDDGLDRTPLKAFSYTQRSTHKPQLNTASPRVLIPVFPGTNCEYDTRRAFERAGAIVNTLVIRNRSAQDIAESVEALQAAIDNAQIIALPGGFSAGDEPDGSGKFIATALRTPRVADAIHRMLYERDGLMLGICNGFQALIKLGLVPYGRIQDMQPAAPTLTFNRIGRHQSRIVRTRVASVLSPWMSGVNVGDIISVPISHGEGRFVCPEGFETLVANGQIATQYVDDSGAPTWDIDYNPNGSMQAVEGITSPDGRILGKMGHNERWQPGLLTNVPGNYDSKIFESGVLYFK
jgi:phosphoribosylformylglycinamidine synthase